MGAKLITAAFLLFSFCHLQAQQVRAITFREDIFDFGSVSEQGGPVTHEFVFTNNSGRPVKILSVQASCGCTTPGWSKEVVAPSKTGFIQASFDPQGRPGYFNKTLTVITDYDANPIILQIKGEVERTGKVAENEYQIANGNWKLRTQIFNMGKVLIKDEVTVREFPFVNAGEKPVTFAGKVVAPAYIKVDVHPATVAPGQKGAVRISYDGKLKNKYGFQSDNVEITTDDEANPVKSFSIYATLEDYFPQLSADEISKAPRLTIGNSIDFGRIKATGQSSKDIQFTNTGKKELSIKSLQGNCTCIAVSASKYTLKPGETGTLHVTFDPSERTGTLTKAVTIYSNDPHAPVQRLTLSAYVAN
jgi:hypothetical protein